jgi:hypothetical protein
VFLCLLSELFCAKDIANFIKAIDKGINSKISNKRSCSFIKKASSYKEANLNSKDSVRLRYIALLALAIIFGAKGGSGLRFGLLLPCNKLSVKLFYKFGFKLLA